MPATKRLPESAIIRALSRVEIALTNGCLPEAHAAITEAFIPELAETIDDDSPLAAIEIPVRVINLLERNKINTVGRLRKSTSLELIALCGLGETGVAEIELLLSHHGLRLRKQQGHG